RAQRMASLCAAKEKLLKDERALAVARSKAQAAAVAQAEKLCAETEKSVEAAAKAIDASAREYAPLSPMYPDRSTGRRTALARWITSRTNPLAARVAVNHLWLRHFGRPLVESVFEFGRAGKEPTHAELLDWLAVELMESKWKMMAIHRMIVLSSVYRMESSAGDAAGRDPDNRGYARLR